MKNRQLGQLYILDNQREQIDFLPGLHNNKNQSKNNVELFNSLLIIAQECLMMYLNANPWGKS
jgi:hypothetical protein